MQDMNQSMEDEIQKTIEEQKSEEFCPHKVAIEVYNGAYGAYTNERRQRLSEAGYTRKQIHEIMTVVDTIKW